MPAYTVATATPADLPHILAMMRDATNQLSFVPATAVAAHLNAAQILIARRAAQPVGYLLHIDSLRHTPSLAAAIQLYVARPHRGRGLATSLHRAWTNALSPSTTIGTQAICGADLPANHLWHALGYWPIVHLTPHNRRRRQLIVWRLLLRPRAPLWFASPPRKVGRRQQPPISIRDPNRSTHANTHATQFITRRAARP